MKIWNVNGVWIFFIKYVPIFIGIYIKESECIYTARWSLIWIKLIFISDLFYLLKIQADCVRCHREFGYFSKIVWNKELCMRKKKYSMISPDLKAKYLYFCQYFKKTKFWIWKCINTVIHVLLNKLRNRYFYTKAMNYLKKYIT